MKRKKKKPAKKANKKTLQKSTKVNEKGKFTDPYSKLDPIYQAAIDLRLYNMQYDRIAAEINRQLKKDNADRKYEEQTIRTWFAKGGKCYDAYQWKKAVRAEERKEHIKEMDDELLAAATEGIVVIRDRIRKNSLQASIEAVKIAKEQMKKKDDKPLVSNTVIYIPSNGRGKNR